MSVDFVESLVTPSSVRKGTDTFLAFLVVPGREPIIDSSSDQLPQDVFIAGCFL